MGYEEGVFNNRSSFCVYNVHVDKEKDRHMENVFVNIFNSMSYKGVYYIVYDRTLSYQNNFFFKKKSAIITNRTMDCKTMDK